MNKALKELIEKALITFNDPNNDSWGQYIGRSKWCNCLIMEATYLMNEKYKAMEKIIKKTLLERMAEVFLDKKIERSSILEQQEQIVELFEKIPMKVERSTLPNE